MMLTKQASTVSKEYWKGDEKLRWTSSWTDCPPSPSGHIYFYWTGVATPGKWPGKELGDTQALHDGVQVSSQPSARLPVRAVHASRPSRQTAASSFGQPPPRPACRATDSAGHTRLPCFCRGWSDSLEFAGQWSARSKLQYRQFWLFAEDVSVSTVFSTLSALEALCDNVLGYINWHLSQAHGSAALC